MAAFICVNSCNLWLTMVPDTKIALSAKELELVCDTGWILTKHTIIQKVYQLFGDVLPQLETILLAQKELLPVEIFINAPKISKGENYRQLPYVMLDYPRYFGKDGTLAIRTFFWWGNFFSVSLQVSGCFYEKAVALLEAKWEWLQQNDYWVCVHNEPWQHHFEEDNFVPVQSLKEETYREILHGRPFIKIAKKIPLQQWEETPLFIAGTFEEMAELLKYN